MMRGRKRESGLHVDQLARIAGGLVSLADAIVLAGRVAGVDGTQLALLPVVPYYKMIGLIGTSACVLTDSSTVQEEATIMGVPCMTLHNYTEHRITVEQGTNIAVGCNSSLIHRAIAEILRGGGKKGRLPKFWDGMTANRTAEHLASWWRQRAPKEAAALIS